MHYLKVAKSTLHERYLEQNCVYDDVGIMIAMYIPYCLQNIIKYGST